MRFSLPPDTPKGQRDAITANDPTITVEAGAGTGKTWVLSQRYLRLLHDNDELLPSDILTLTYTEAAAGEMKARIEALITEALEDFPDRERRQNILDGLSDSWISTIHAFAGRLIRESGLSLDIDPRASVITDHQEQAFWEEIRNAAEFGGLERLARNYGGGELLKSAKSLDDDPAMSWAVGKWGAASLCTFARKTAEVHASSGRSWCDMLNWSVNDDELVKQAEEMVKSVLCSELRGIWRTWRNVRLDGVKKDDAKGQALNAFLDSMRANPPKDYDSLKAFYLFLVDGDVAGRSGAFSQLKGILGGVTFGRWRQNQKDSITYSVIQNFSSPITPEEVQMRKVLMKFCAVSWGMWDEMKKHRGLLSFSDMILHAKRTVEDKGIRKTFRHILVDEFQDTDPLQFTMIESLKDYEENTGLFAVGDPKQSIYKFRHADPSLFAEIMGRSGTNNIHLDKSFRTRSSLLGRINKIFTSLWPDGISRQDAMRGVKYNPIDAASNDVERESGTMPDFRIILAGVNGKADDAKRLLASKLATKISSWVSNNATVWDKREKLIRPVKYSDFAILARGRGDFPILEEALEAAGIPSVQDRSDDYFGRGEIGDVVCTLRAAADFGDDFSVMGWLMSPFSGVKEHDAITQCLALVDETHRPVDLIRDNLPVAYSRLERLAVTGENAGASGVLALLDADRSWLSCYRPGDRLRVLRNVRLAMEIARNYEASGASGLVSCAEYMTRSIRNKAGYEEPSWHDEDENAVRLGAVHSAKGLEYPITVIFEGRTGRIGERSSVVPSRELGLVVKSLPDETGASGGFRSRLAEWHKFLSEQGDSEEEERLFYVACTRAQDSLIFCGLLTPNGNTYANTWTRLLLDNVKGIEGIDKLTEKVKADDGAQASASGTQEEVRLLRPVECVHVKRSLRQISATSFALFEWCPYAWRRQYRQGVSLSWELPDSERDDDEETHGGAALGSLTHWVLSEWTKDGMNEAQLDELLYQNSTLQKIPAKLRDVWRDKKKINAKNNIRKWLMNFAASDLGVRLRNAQDVRREYRFRVRLDDATQLAGSIDALSGSDIIDYKITAIKDVPPGLYESQLDFYAYVMHELTGAESVNTCLAFLRENRTVNRPVNDFEAVRSRILRAAEICASGPYNASTNHCGLCPFRKGCVKNAGIR